MQSRATFVRMRLFLDADAFLRNYFPSGAPHSPAYVMAARGSPRPDLGARTEENWRSERPSGKATQALKKLANSTASKLEKLSAEKFPARLKLERGSTAQIRPHEFWGAITSL